MTVCEFPEVSDEAIIVDAHGFGKTMDREESRPSAILAGHSARFLNAADFILDLTRQETARARQHRLRSYSHRISWPFDEVGYLSYDPHAADLLFLVVRLRAEVSGDHAAAAFRDVGPDFRGFT